MADLLGDLLKAAGRVATFVQSAPAGVPERIWGEVSPWLTNLLTRASSKWIPVLTAGFECEVLVPERESPTGWAGCTKHAVTICDCCAHRTCLHHCRIDANGDAICAECIAAAHRVVAAEPRVAPRADPRRPPPAGAPPPKAKMTRAAALKILGLTGAASEEEIRKAYKQLSVLHHPDRYQGEKEKDAAQQRFVKVQAAWERLKDAAK